MAELRGTFKVDNTLGAQFLGNLAAAMYVTIPNGVERGEMMLTLRLSLRQFLWHYMRTDLYILQEEL
jgi:hypothetical protein